MNIVHCQENCATRNIKESTLGWREIIPNKKRSTRRNRVQEMVNNG